MLLDSLQDLLSYSVDSNGEITPTGTNIILIIVIIIGIWDMKKQVEKMQEKRKEEDRIEIEELLYEIIREQWQWCKK